MARTTRQALRGKSSFVSDIYLKGMLYGATIRSPFPHARILSIDATNVPPGATVVTANDIRGDNRLCVGDECMPVLASGVCLYAGEPVALIAAATQAEVVEASLRLDIDFEELQPHLEKIEDKNGQVAIRVTGKKGDPERRMRESDQVVEGTYNTGIQEHLYNEPQGAVVEIRADGTLVVHCATQWPYHVQQTVIRNLAVSHRSCVVAVTDTGVDLDGKLWYPSLVATHAAILSRATGKSIKLVYSNQEDFQYTSKRAPVTVTHLTGLDAEGGLQAASVNIRYNCGAYPLFTKELTDRLSATAMGLYACENVKVTVEVVCTNLPPLNILSGFGTASTQFAAETHAARLIEISGFDPVEWRVKRLGDGNHRRIGREIASETMSAAVHHSDFSRKNAAYSLQSDRRSPGDTETARGIGIAIAAEASGFAGSNESNYESALSVVLGTDGAVLRTSIHPRASSLRRHWTALVAEGLGLDPSDVRIESGRTGDVPDSGPSTLSRSILISGRLISQACSTIQRRRFRDPLPIEVKRSYRMPRNASWNAGSLTGTAFVHSAFGAAVVEVSVDPVSFETRVEDVWLAVDAGHVLDEDSTRRSLEMGIYQSLEWTTHELVRYRDGEIDPRNYLSYRRVLRRNLPRINITLMESSSDEPCGVGSLPFSCVPAALASAVSQATGRYMDRIPTNPELVHGYLEGE